MDRTFLCQIALILLAGLLILGLARTHIRMTEHAKSACDHLPTEADRDYCFAMVNTGLSAGW